MTTNIYKTATKLERSYWPADNSADLIESSVGDLLRQVASEVPDRIALVDGVAESSRRRRWTYRELLSTAEAVARSLLGKFEVGERIAVFAPNSAEWILLQHGLSLAGLILVPINPAYSKRELSLILKNCEAAGLFYVDEYRGRDIRAMVEEMAQEVPGLRQSISFSDWEQFVRECSDSTPLPNPESSDAVLIQHTSGTTGVPKGATLHHSGVINTCRFVAQRAGFPEGGVWLNAMPLFHIAGSVVSELGTLNARGTFVIVPGFEPDLMLELIESERANCTLIVPTMIITILENPELASFDLSSLRTVLTGAADVPASLVRKTKEVLNCDLSILFGQTECNGVVSQTSLDDTVADQAETLGRPLPQTEVCIADPDTGEIREIGEAGEICVRGYQTMLGYYGMEEATRKTIREDGWLHTGDLGVMDSRGYLRLAGRLRDVIIRGGINIYPREIEEVLFEHPGVSQVSVIGESDEKWGEIIAAVIIPVDKQAPPSVEEIFSYCRNQLAAHKSPVKWYFTDSYPLTPSGKVQKFILKQWISEGRLKEEIWNRSQRQA